MLLNRKARATLIVVAVIASWGADATLAAVGGHDSIRSITQGIAVTLTVLAGMARMWKPEPRRAVGISRPVAPAWVRASASVDTEQITMEIPRPRIPAPSPPPRSSLSNIPAAVAGELYRLGRIAAGARSGRRSM